MQRIKEKWVVWKGLLDGGVFEGNWSETDGGVHDDWWNARWVPLTYGGSGDHHSLDLEPGEGGTVRQFILMWHDMPERPIVAPSFEAWLGRFADDREAGLYAYSEDHGGLVSYDEIGDE